MLKRFATVAATLAASSNAPAQNATIVDVLASSETSSKIPPGTRIVDIYVDVAETNVWTAAGIRAVTENGAAIRYFDADANTPGLQPGLFNGGVANQFATMLSKPRARDAAERFENAGAFGSAAFDPPGPPRTSPNELNVTYFADPPETPQSPSVDGYIARIAIDISGVAGAPDEDSLWDAGSLTSVPPGAVVVLRSVGVLQPGGTLTETFGHATLSNWAMWFVPEPGTAGPLALGGLAAIRRRRSFPQRRGRAD